MLLWHFTDQFYHTDLDRIDMVSATTLGNVGNCALTTGLLLASATPAISAAALSELTEVAERELGTQGTLSATALKAGGDVAKERLIIETWRDYYVAALARINDIDIGGATASPRVDAQQQRVRRTAEQILATLR